MLPAAITDPFDLLGIFLLMFLLVTVCTGAVLAAFVKLLVRNLLGMTWRASAGMMLKLTAIEVVAMTFAFLLSFFFVSPLMSPKGAPALLVYVALFGGAWVFHATVAVFPNLKLLQQGQTDSRQSNASAKDISTALVFSLITPCIVTLLMLFLVRSALAW